MINRIEKELWVKADSEVEYEKIKDIISKFPEEHSGDVGDVAVFVYRSYTGSSVRLQKRTSEDIAELFKEVLGNNDVKLRTREIDVNSHRNELSPDNERVSLERIANALERIADRLEGLNQ